MGHTFEGLQAEREARGYPAPTWATFYPSSRQGMKHRGETPRWIGEATEGLLVGMCLPTPDSEEGHLIP